MPKLYPKKHFFVFLASVFVTVFVGYFAWSAVIGVGGNFVNKILSYTDKISADFFSASVLQKESQVGDIIPDVNLTSDDYVDEAPAEEVIQDPPIIEESRQDLLDDIQEKLDIIQSQVNDLIVEQNQNDQVDKPEEDLKDQDKQEEDKIKESVVCTGEININIASLEDLDKIIGVGPTTAQKIIEARPFYSLNDLLKVSGIGEATLQKIIEQSCAYVDPGLVPPVVSGGGGGGGVPTPGCKNATNIFISEFQVDGETASDDWVEFYNPNDDAACLNSWSIQKASITGKISHVKNFISSALIPARGYYLVADSDASQNILQIADMTASSLDLSSEFAGGNTIYLVNKKDEIVDGNDENIVDKVGYGLAKDYKVLPALKPSVGRSTGRIWDEMLQEYKNINNNSTDFEIDTPTPKAPNIAYSEPVQVDKIAPVITLTGDPEITINIGDIYGDAGATAIDDVDGDITANIVVVNPVDAETVGDYIITYNVFDGAGNNAVEVTRLVHVAIITLPPIPDDTALEVSSFYPADNSINVPIDVQPTLTFSEAIDPKTVKLDYIQLREYSSATAKVSDAVTLSEDGTVVGLHLSSPLEYNKQYYFFISSKVTNIIGTSFVNGTWYHSQREKHEFTTVTEVLE